MFFGELGQGHRRRPPRLITRRPATVGVRAATDHGIDRDRVSAWLAEHIDGAVAPFEFALIAGDVPTSRSASPTRTDVDSCSAARRSGAVLATAHDMAREHRIIAAVGTTDVPVPPALGCASTTRSTARRST